MTTPLDGEELREYLETEDEKRRAEALTAMVCLCLCFYFPSILFL